MMRSRVLGGRCRSINSNYRFFPRKSRNRQGRPLSHARNSFVLAGTGRAARPATIPVVLTRSKNAGDRNLAIFESAWWRLIPRRSSISERYSFGGRHEPIIILRPIRLFSGVAEFILITVSLVSNHLADLQWMATECCDCGLRYVMGSNAIVDSMLVLLIE